MDVIQSTINSLIYPAAVALLAAILSYLGTYFAKKYEIDNNKRTSRIDLVDRMNIELDKLVALLNKLNEEVQQFNYFPFSTINSLNFVVNKLNPILDNVVVFSDDKLRKTIIELVGKISTFVEEAYQVEKAPASGYEDLQKLTKERETEYRSLQVQLLAQNIYWDKTTKKFDYINKKKEKTNETRNLSKTNRKLQLYSEQDTELPAVEDILQNLLSDITRGQSKLEENQKLAASRRTYLSLKIITLVQDTKDLLTQLADHKKVH